MYSQDPAEDNSLIVTRHKTPLVVDVSTVESNTVSKRPTTGGKDGKEGNVKMEDYSVVCEFIKKYVKTINDKSF